jgi:glyoxylate reductase
MDMQPLVYISRQMPQAVLDIIAPHCEYDTWSGDTMPPREVFLQAVAAADGVMSTLTEQIDAAFLDAAPRCKVVANIAVGYDNVDVPALTARQVLLTNTPDVLNGATADLAWALLMATSRRIVEAQKSIEANEWGSWSLNYMTGQQVSGATLGIVGAGRIGSAVARRATGFDMPILYHNRRPVPMLEIATGAQYRPLDDLLREADCIVVLVPLTPETRGMFGAREFALMKPTAVFVNVSRGPVVDEAALYDALQQGRPWAAGLDVFAQEPIRADHPLLTLPNVVALPHIGSATVQTRLRMATLAAENLVAALTGQPVPNPVNSEVLTNGKLKTEG